MTNDNARLNDEAAKRPFNPDGGEDEASTSHEGNDDHLHDAQKPITGNGGPSAAGDDDPHKAEKLTKAGRDIDPNEGSD